MTRYLVDTNILSARKETAIVEWLDAASPVLWLSTISAAEIAAGIARKRREGAHRQADALQGWWNAVVHLYGERILPFDLAAATIAGEIIDRTRAEGSSPGFADIAIAATAIAHDLVVLTRNVRHFAPLGARLVSPYEGLPPLPE